MRRLPAALLTATLLAGGAPTATAAPVPAARDGLPSEREWRADVREVMAGSIGDLERRVEAARPGARLAVNLDIDNTMLATHYDEGQPVPPVLRYARRANELGVKVFVNTARTPDRRDHTVEQLAAAGYDVDRICMRRPGTPLARGKQACRDFFASKGFRLIANVGNRPTDFEGDGYERAYRLPSYGKRIT